VFAFGTSACHEISFHCPSQRTASGYRVSAVLDIYPNQTSRPGASITSGVLPAIKASAGWTGTHPVFRFNLDQAEGWQFEANPDFSPAIGKRPQFMG
jgi:hypothetical protein